MPKKAKAVMVQGVESRRLYNREFPIDTKELSWNIINLKVRATHRAVCIIMNLKTYIIYKFENL